MDRILHGPVSGKRAPRASAYEYCLLARERIIRDGGDGVICFQSGLRLRRAVEGSVIPLRGQNKCHISSLEWYLWRRSDIMYKRNDFRKSTPSKNR